MPLPCLTMDVHCRLHNQGIIDLEKKLESKPEETLLHAQPEKMNFAAWFHSYPPFLCIALISELTIKPVQMDSNGQVEPCTPATFCLFLFPRKKDDRLATRLGS